MNLERIIQEFPKKYHAMPRKVEPLNENFIIYGAPRSGKTVTLHRFLWDNCKQGKGIYIDFDDWRYEELSFKEFVEFAKTKNLTHIAIDNAPADLSSIDGICIAAATKEKQSTKNFETLRLKALDFEEFIAFEKHGVKIEDDSSLASVFGRFAHIGNLPEKLNYPDAQRVELIQKNINNICTNQTQKEILKALCSHQSHQISLLQLYTYIKQRCKISKDSLYESVQNFQNIELLQTVTKYLSPKSPKKLYFSDFCLPSTLSDFRDFGRLFENAVFCEMEHKDIFYTDALSFYIPSEQLAIITRPFDDKEALEARIKKTVAKTKNLDIKRLAVITMHTNLEYNIGDIEIVAEPFWSWAVQK
ncbi:MAG: hypothetical protein RL154_733 [Pseudomonadota bacterium]|jgi:predicted AAA+ superfamily ATPase